MWCSLLKLTNWYCTSQLEPEAQSIFEWSSKRWDHPFSTLDKDAGCKCRNRKSERQWHQAFLHLTTHQPVVSGHKCFSCPDSSAGLLSGGLTSLRHILTQSGALNLSINGERKCFISLYLYASLCVHVWYWDNCCYFQILWRCAAGIAMNYTALHVTRVSQRG